MAKGPRCEGTLDPFAFEEEDLVKRVFALYLAHFNSLHFIYT